MERIMRSWTSCRVTALALLWLATLLSPNLGARVARGQVRIPAESAGTEEALTPILQKGQQLERERRWSEAVGVYEDGAKQYPERRELLDRATLARAHFDVTRRYSDDSFARSLSNAEEKTLETYPNPPAVNMTQFGK